MDNQRVIESFERIVTLAERLLMTFDVEELLSKIVHDVQDLLEAEGATLYLVDPVEKLMISQVILSDRVEEIILSISTDSIAGFTAFYRKGLIIPDAYGDLAQIHPDLKFNRSIDASSMFKTRDIITHPLILKDELIGVFQIVNKKNGKFDESDRTLLRNFSVLAGIAIMNARLMERVVKEQGNANDIVEHISEEVYIQDRDGMLLHINRQASERLPTGMTFDKVCGKPLLEVFPHLAGLRQEIKKIIDSNLDKAFSGGKMPYVIVTGKNSRQVVEKVFILVKQVPEVSTTDAGHGHPKP
ncbi:MAG: GAF domain-containing protein [Candidatus Riflebacteria bacterium]|nr:GAF domain-containing protein [Candidatus Riflebacteria bacterium]